MYFTFSLNTRTTTDKSRIMEKRAHAQPLKRQNVIRLDWFLLYRNLSFSHGSNYLNRDKQDNEKVREKDGKVCRRVVQCVLLIGEKSRKRHVEDNQRKRGKMGVRVVDGTLCGDR